MTDTTAPAGEGVTAFEMMKGTEGNLDYIVIAKQPEKGLQLGLKVLWGLAEKDGSTKVVVGLRLREARIPEVVPMGEFSKVTEPKDPGQGWSFDWERVNHKRASLIRVLMMERGPDEIQLLMADLKSIRFGYKALAFVQAKSLPEQWVLNVDQLNDYIIGALAEGINQAAAAVDPVAKLEFLNTQKTKFDTWFDQQVAETQKAIDDLGAVEKGETPDPMGALTDLISPSQLASSASTGMLKSLQPAKFSVIEGGLSDLPTPPEVELPDPADLPGTPEVG